MKRPDAIIPVVVDKAKRLKQVLRQPLATLSNDEEVKDPKRISRDMMAPAKEGEAVVEHGVSDPADSSKKFDKVSIGTKLSFFVEEGQGRKILEELTRRAEEEEAPDSEARYQIAKKIQTELLELEDESAEVKNIRKSTNELINHLRTQLPEARKKEKSEVHVAGIMQSIRNLRAQTDGKIEAIRKQSQDSQN